MMKPGGVRRDIDEEDIPIINKLMNELEAKTAMFIKAALDDPVIAARLANVGILTHEEAIRYGVVGPTARGSGVAIDVRKDDPYAAYDLVPWDMIVFEEGDLLAKAKVRLIECLESMKMIRECTKKMKPGEIETRIEDIPPGEGIGRHEAPRGEVFHYARSDGSNMPVRYKVRAPSYMNIPSNVVAVKGYDVADAVLVLASVDPCYCCTERMVTLYDGNKKLTGKDLIKLSWEKTEKLKNKFRHSENKLTSLI